MTNIVNLSDKRKQKKPLPDNYKEIVDEFVIDYMNAAIQDMPLNVLVTYARMGLHNEIRAMNFIQVVEKIEKEYPDIACFYKEQLLP